MYRLPKKQAHDSDAIKARKAELSAYSQKLLHRFAEKRHVSTEGSKKEIIEAIIEVEYEQA